MTHTVITNNFGDKILDLRECASARSVLQSAWREGLATVYVSQEVYKELMDKWHMNPEYGNIDIYNARGAAKCFIHLSKSAINKGRVMSC